MKIDKEKVAQALADGWKKYTHWFGQPPHGTVKQMAALLELSSVDKWLKPKCKGRGCSGANCDA